MTRSRRDIDSGSDSAGSDFSPSHSPKRKVAKRDNKPKKKVEEKKAAVKSPPRKKKDVPKEAEEQRASSGDEDENRLGEDYDDDDLLNIQIPPKPKPCMNQDGTGARLMITEIIVDNFKSYYGTRRIGPFHQNFTSIIGPNGSGKSNVIDALLFVFGYKASKIRSKKLSVLIHSSAGKDDINSCSVKIIFQKVLDRPDGKFDVLPGSDFYVSRTAYKNNTSDYRYNGQKMTIKDVAQRLRAVGIDLDHNRFLILQGEVEQIAMMKAKAQTPNEEGMLEYLEDIIGSSRYKVPINKLTEKLETLQTEKSHQNAKANLAMKEKEAMEGPVHEMINYLQIENSIAVMQAKKNYLRRFATLKKINDLVPKKEAHVKELEAMDVEVQEIDTKIEEEKSEIGKNQKTHNNATLDLERLENEIGVVKQRDNKRESDYKRVQKELKDANAKYTKAKKELEEARQAPLNAAKEMEQLKGNMDELHDILKTAQELYDENFPKFTKKTESDREKKAEMEKEHAVVAQTLAEANGKLKVAEGQLSSLEEDYNAKKKRVDNLEEVIMKNNESIESKTKDAKTCREKIPALETEQKSVRHNLEKWRERQVEIEQEMAKLQTLADASSEAVNNQTMSRQQKALHAAKANGKMPGFYGRLGDLGTVEERYDCAISSTVNQLDYYVVDTVTTANKCIALLQEGNHGLGTFLALDKQEHLWQYVKSRDRFPLPRLFDQVKVDQEEIKLAFYFALRDALIAKDMDEATRVNKDSKSTDKRQFRIITLKGEVLDPSGTMQGGGKVVEGRIGKRRDSIGRGDAATAAQVMEAQKKLEELGHEFTKVVDDIKSAERRLFELTSGIREETKRADKLENEAKILADRQTTFESQLSEMKKDLKKAANDEKEVAKLKQEIEELRKSRDEAQEMATATLSKIKAVDLAIKSHFNKTVKVHQEAKEKAEKDIEAAEAGIAKSQAIINASEKAIDRAMKKCQDVEADVDKKRNTTTELNNMQEMYGKREEEMQRDRRALEKKPKKKGRRSKEKRKSKDTSTREEEEEEEEEKNVEDAEQTKKEEEDLGDLDEVDPQTETYLPRFLARLEMDFGDHFEKKMRKLGKDAPKFHLYQVQHLFKFYKAKVSRQEEILKELRDKVAEYDKRLREIKDKVMEHKDKIKEIDRRTAAYQNDMMAAQKEIDHVKLHNIKELDITLPKNTAEKTQRSRAGYDMSDDDEDTSRMHSPTKRPDPEVPVEDTNTGTEQDLTDAGVMPKWTDEELEEMDTEGIEIRLSDLQKQREAKRKFYDKHILADYKTKLDRVKAEVEALTAISEHYTKHRQQLEKFKKGRLDEFMTGFKTISFTLKEMYQMITLGGDASLELKDLIDPFVEGVLFMVRPPKKSWKQIENLSGGEKTLSSLALVFALHHYRPTPLYVMDEIDAALDFRNVSIIGHYIKDRTKNAQFIIISLRNNMFELADRLVGIYKVHDCTKNVVVDPMAVVESTRQMREGLKKIQQVIGRDKNLHNAVMNATRMNETERERTRLERAGKDN